MQDAASEPRSAAATRKSELGAPGLTDSPEVLERFHSELALVETIAASVCRSIGRSVDLDDLRALGREGLLDAARRFDPTRGVPFGAFASYRVHGAVRDGVRQFSPLPRRTYERLAALQAAAEVSEGDAEHAFAGGAVADPRAARRALEEHLSSIAVAAAVGMAAETRGEGSDASSPEEALARAELLHIVRGALADLEDHDEAEVVRRHYLEGEYLEDIARDLDISKSWATRLHTRAIARLAKRLRGLTR